MSKSLLLLIQSAVSLEENSGSTASMNERGEETEQQSEILGLPSQGIWLVVVCSITNVLTLSILFCIRGSLAV